MMKTIKDGIVYSDDIYLILKGYNNLDYNYNGIIMPDKTFIGDLRKDFKKTVDEIFPRTQIVSEEEMVLSIYTSLRDVLGIYPHCLSR